MTQRPKQSVIPGVFTTQAAPARFPIFYEVDVSDRPFPLDYRQRNYVYVFSLNATIQLWAAGYGPINVLENTWTSIPFPETTKLNLPGQTTYNHLIVQCTDLPLVVNTMQVPRVPVDLLFLPRFDAGDSYSTDDINVQQLSELAIDFTIYSISGGVSPKAGLAVVRAANDGNYYVLEQAPLVSSSGVFSYSVGAGLDGKAFGSAIQVNLVTTGGPTNVNMSGSIKGK